MTKVFSIALQGQLASARSQLATCILLTRTDGNAYGFTTYDRTLLIGSVAYRPAASFNPSNIASNLNLDQDNVTAEALLDDDTLSEDDLRAGKWDYATFRIFQVNWADLTMGDKKDKTGHLGQVTVNRQTFVADLLGLMEAYIIAIGAVTQPGCRYNLGDVNCGVDLIGGSPSLTVTGTVGFDAGDFFTIADASRGEAEDYFTEGVITFTSGLADGLSYELKKFYAGGGMVTKTPIAYNVSGATYSMHAGCMRRFLEDCVKRFSNGGRFGGEPWLRGPDAAVQVGRHG